MAPRVPNDVWWRRRVGYLEEMADRVRGIRSDVNYCKEGAWPLLKLAWADYWLRSFAQILKRSSYDRLHFVDLCAGSGLSGFRPKKGPEKIVAGTAVIGASANGFDAYHFAEPRKGDGAVMQERVASIRPNARFYLKNRAAAAVEIADAIQRESANPHFIAYIDVEGFNDITIPQLEPLLNLAGDVFVNFQSFMAVREPAAVANFLGVPASPDLAGRPFAHYTEKFVARLREFDRPAILEIPIVSGGESGAYFYTMVYAARRTRADNPWLTNMRRQVESRMQGMDGARLEAYLAGEKTMESFVQDVEKRWDLGKNRSLDHFG